MRRILILAALLAVPGLAVADDININGALGQQNFDDLSQDLGAVTSYKQLEGSASEGITGFDVSFNAGATQVDHQAAWAAATGSSTTTVPFADVRVSKGLPLGFDIGGEYSFVPGSNVKLYGFEGRYAILDGGLIEPSVSLRAAYTKLSGVDNLSFDTKTLDVSVSKGFGPVTPYAGVGEVWTNSTPDASTGLVGKSFSNTEVFAGVTFNLGVHLALEYNRIAGNTTYGIKLGFGF